jgi:hypothetical protein
MSGKRQRSSLKALHHKSSVSYQLKVKHPGLTLAGQVVTQEDGIGQMKSEGLKTSQVNLTSSSNPNFNVGKEETIEGQNAKATLGG